jgi:uncharacterized membrane protein YcaP (DUF421 family)
MDLVIRAAVVFTFVFLVMRVAGRRELTSLEPFDLIMLVVMGDLVQQGVTQNDNSVTGVFLVISMVALFSAGLAYMNFRFRPVRSVLEGEPLILVQDGQPIAKNLRRERLTIDEVEAEARLQQIPSLEQVQWAVLETNGQISFIASSNGSSGADSRTQAPV